MIAKWELAPDVGGRHRKSKDEKASAESNWTDRRGAYLGPFLKGNSRYPYYFENRTTEAPDDLVGMELVLKNHILRTLQTKRAAEDSSPVLVVDFGGMYGLSFARLALNLEADNQLVSRGEVVMVVTNLVLDEGQLVSRLRGGISGSYEPLSDEALLKDQGFIQQALDRGLVHYIATDAAGLRQQAVRLPNGSDLRLHRNIDIVHESSVFIHGRKNDVDLPLIARSLSYFGTLLLGSPKTMATRDDTVGEAMSKEQAHQLGKKNLLQESMQMQVFNLPTYYEVYAKPNAPPVEINSESTDSH